MQLEAPSYNDTPDTGIKASTKSYPNRNLLPKLRALIPELKARGDRLPGYNKVAELSSHSDAELFADIDLVSVASAIHHSPAELLATEPFRTVLLEAARELGLAPKTVGAPTLQDLFDRIPLKVARDFADRSQQVISCRTATLIETLQCFQHKLVLPGKIRLDTLFQSPTYEQIETAFLAHLNANQRDHSSQDLYTLKTMALELLTSVGQPKSFSAALAQLAYERWQTVQDMATKTGINRTRLNRWLSGGQPEVTHIDDVKAIEHAYGLEPGALTNLINAQADYICIDAILTKELKQELESMGIPMGVFPRNWSVLSDERKREVLAEIEEKFFNLRPYPIYLREVHRRAISYADLPKPMQTQFDSLRSFKTVAIANDNQPRRFIVINRGGKEVRVHRTWRKVSADMTENFFRRMITHIGSTLDDEARAALDQADLGCFANPKFLRRGIDMIARRRYKILNESGLIERLSITPVQVNGLMRVYTTSDVTKMYTIAGLFHSEAGYLYHHPPEHLVAIPDLISQEWVDEANANWRKFAKKQFKKMTAQIEQIEKLACEIRDAAQPIQPLLDLDQPMMPLLRALDLMEKDRPDFMSSPHHTAKFDEHFCMMSMMIHHTLRRLTWTKLTYRPVANDGNIRWNGDTLELHIPQSMLKNAGSIALPEKNGCYVLELEKDDPSLYRAVLQWITYSRPVVHGDDCGTFLFPGLGATDKDDRGVTENTVNWCVMRFSSMYLVELSWREGGVPGVHAFGPHAIRHIIYCHVRKLTNSREMAAAAIGDTPDQAEKRYWHNTSGIETSRQTNEVIKKTRRK